VPTAAEAGYPDFLLEAWVALFAPAGTPPEAIAKLTASAREALASPEAVEKIRATGMTMRYLPPVELDGVVKADLAYWGKVIRDAKIKAD
jgi:tripartite-type tricarboxylate transporter receptor subunit TctC